MIPSACKVHHCVLTPIPTLSYSQLVEVFHKINSLSIDSSMIILKQGKKNNKLFWVPAIAPLISTILSTSIVYITRADKHGVQIVSAL